MSVYVSACLCVRDRVYVFVHSFVCVRNCTCVDLYVFVRLC